MSRTAFPRLPGLRPVREQLEQLAQKAAKRRGFDEQRLLIDWPLIVGAEIAALCQPVRIRNGRNGSRQGVLELQTQDAGAALQLQYQELLILERIHRYLGHAAVARIQLRRGAASPATPGRSESR